MHGAAAPAGATCGPAQDFGKQGFETPSFRQIFAVRAVPSPSRILGPKRRAHARGHGLLADAKVTGTARFPARDHLSDGLLGGADQEHAPPAFEQPREGMSHSITLPSIKI